MNGQGTKRSRNIVESFNRLSRAHKRYRRQTDRRQTDGRRHIANMLRQGLPVGAYAFLVLVNQLFFKRTSISHTTTVQEMQIIYNIHYFHL